jgi:N-sulfoglucosamine sulfohydrolase
MGLAHAPYGWRLPPEVPHTAHLLAQAGYSTALVGMQHLIERGSAHELGYQRIEPVAPAYEEAETAVGLLRELAHRADPFYLEVGFEEPHRPYDFGGAVPDTSRGVSVPGYLPDVLEAHQDLAAFQGAIRQMDAGVGSILAALDEAGLTESTCVVFVTDHGAAMPRAKCTLYDPGIEVALLWRWPSQGLSGGRVISPLVSNVDVTPTLLDGLGLAMPAGVEGRSLWPLLQGRTDRAHDHVFAEKTFHTYYEPMRAIRSERHKLIVNFEVSTRVDVPSDIRQSPIYPVMQAEFDAVRAPIELYDLIEDPWERHNVAGTADLATVEAELRARLLAWMRVTQDPLLDGPVASPYYADAVSWLEKS